MMMTMMMGRRMVWRRRVVRRRVLRQGTHLERDRAEYESNRSSYSLH